jgi:hypothetical protein
MRMGGVYWLLVRGMLEFVCFVFVSYFVVVCCRVLQVGIVGLVRCRAKVVYYEHCISLLIRMGLSYLVY